MYDVESVVVKIESQINNIDRLLSSIDAEEKKLIRSTNRLKALEKRLRDCNGRRIRI